MPLYERVSGTYKTLTLYERISSVWTKVILWERVSGTWKQVGADPLSVAAPDVNGSGAAFSSSGLVSAGTTAVGAGGLPGYSYSSAYVSGDNTMTTSGLSTATPTFSKTLSAGQQSTTTINAVYRVTVTDSISQTATHDYNVSLSYTNELG